MSREGHRLCRLVSLLGNGRTYGDPMSAMAFLAKKIISVFFYPLGVSLVLLFCGMLLWRRTAKRRLGFGMTLLGTLLLLVMSLPITGFLLTHHLEAKAGDYGNPSELAQKGVRYIVVLAHSTVTGESLAADRWGRSILGVMEGMRLRKGIPNSVLVLSGGSSPGRQSEAEAMAELPCELGVPRESLVLETRAWDTLDEARIFAQVVGKEPFALVTLAEHMPRSMELFEAFGLHPVSCPYDFATRERPTLTAQNWPLLYKWFVPNAGSLLESHSAIHEYVGILWFRIRRVLVGLPPSY